MKKIAHINLAKNIRGGEFQTIALIEELMHQKREYHILICRKNSPLCKLAKEKKIKTFPIGKPFLANIFKVKDFDILHVHEGRSIYFAFIAFKFFKIPYIVTRRIPNRPNSKFITKLAYKNAKCIISLSNKIQQVMQEFIQPKCFSVIPSISRNLKADIKNVKELKKRFQDKFIIGHIGALSNHHKNQLLIIKAAKELSEKYPNFLFLLLGSGKDEKMLKKASFGVDNIVFEGFKSNVADYYELFDVFVYPSVEEGLGSAILDAFNFKLPIIASKVDGIVDIIQDSFNGILIDPLSVNELKESIKKIYHNKEYRKKLSTNAFNSKKKYISKVIAAKYIKVYDENG